MNPRPKTIICDIDGTLVKHHLPVVNSSNLSSLEIIPETLRKISEWDAKGYNIILITGRKESMRRATEEQLSRIGIIYDQLIMGIGGGDRVLINDRKPTGEDTAFAINIDRDKGIGELNI
jgi:FMN phosphatase YigB (HAD superfamily)